MQKGEIVIMQVFHGGFTDVISDRSCDPIAEGTTVYVESIMRDIEIVDEDLVCGTVDKFTYDNGNFIISINFDMDALVDNSIIEPCDGSKANFTIYPSELNIKPVLTQSRSCAAS